MARPRSPGYDEQRGRILREAANLFARAGFPGTSMNEVARACHISKPTLYHYFTDKQQLLAEICEGHLVRLEALIDGLEADPRDSRALLRDAVCRLVEEYGRSRNEHRVLTEDVKFLDAAHRGRLVQRERRVVAAMAALVARVRPDAARQHLTKPLTMLLFGMINWMFTWMRPDGSLDYPGLAPMVADLFLEGLSDVPLPRHVRSAG